MMVGQYAHDNVGCSEGPTQTAAALMMVINGLLVSVLLVNLLVAMMGTAGGAPAPNGGSRQKGGRSPTPAMAVP